MEKDLDVIIHESGKVTEQCNTAAASANRILGLIKTTIKYKSKAVIINLYKSLVRQKLEYCAQLWNPYLKKNVNVLERVQKRATKLIAEFRGIKDEERLKRYGL